MRRKIKLINANCTRCGKNLVASDRSFYGADSHKKAFGIVCDTCASPKELREILKVAGKAIQQSLGQKFEVTN